MEYISDLHRYSAEATNKTLASFFQESIAEAEKISSNYSKLWRHMETVVMHGGKRLRPYLAIVGFGQYDEASIQKTVPFAAALELLHAALLMHDDVIDRDDIRHGADNLNGLYKKEYVSVAQPDRTHYAHSAAILAGDLLISAAHRLIIANTTDPEDQVVALAQLYQSNFEVAGGQLMDVEATFLEQEELRALPIATHKTASYSFIGPLLTGARLAHAPKKQIDTLRTFGLNLGIAYQLQDDVLGVFGDASVTGKSTVNDIREAKHTYLIEQYIASNQVDTQLLKSVFGNADASDAEIARFKQSLQDSGARTQTEEAIKSYIEKAQSALDGLDHDQPIYNELCLFLHKIITRSK